MQENTTLFGRTREANGRLFRAAGKQFNVDESCVRRWRSQRGKLVETPRNKRALRGRSAAFPELEKEVAEWITEKRKAGTGVSTNIIRLKAKNTLVMRIRPRLRLTL